MARTCTQFLNHKTCDLMLTHPISHSHTLLATQTLVHLLIQTGRSKHVVTMANFGDTPFIYLLFSRAGASSSLRKVNCATVHRHTHTHSLDLSHTHHSTHTCTHTFAFSLFHTHTHSVSDRKTDTNTPRGAGILPTVRKDFRQSITVYTKTVCHSMTFKIPSLKALVYTPGRFNLV